MSDGIGKASPDFPGGSASPGAGVSARRVVERLDEATCAELLSAGRVGRLVYNSRYGPVALPSEYKMHGGSILFRTYQATFTEEDLRTGIAYADPDGSLADELSYKYIGGPYPGFAGPDPQWVTVRITPGKVTTSWAGS